MNKIIQFPIKEINPFDELKKINAEDITIRRPAEQDCPTCHGTGMPVWPMDVKEGEVVELYLCGKCQVRLFGRIKYL